MLTKLDADEAERLQTVPQGYTDHVAEGHRFKMLGNGWTIDVIAHLLKPIAAGVQPLARPIGQCY